MVLNKSQTRNEYPTYPPLFIVGNPRSGTTLLRFILSTHSRIYIPEETGFLGHLSDYRGIPLTEVQVAAVVQKIGDMNFEWHEIVSDMPAFCKKLSGESVAAVIDALYRIKAEQHGAERWGDKTPTYVTIMDEIDSLYPNAQYIHMIRDGRDCCASALKKWGSKWYLDGLYILNNWKRNVTAGQSHGAIIGDKRYLEVRYEDLVENNEQTVRKICTFLGESFEPAMLDHTTTANALVDKCGHYETKRNVTAINVGNWKRSLSPFHIKLAQRTVGSELAHLGYEINPGRMTASEWCKYLGLRSKFMFTNTLRTTLYRVGILNMSSSKRRKRIDFRLKAPTNITGVH